MIISLYFEDLIYSNYLSVGSKIVQIVEVISKPILKSVSLNTEEKLPHTETYKKLSGIAQPTSNLYYLITLLIRIYA